MSLILDVILVAIFVSYVIVAAKKGFVRTLLEVVAVIAAIFLSFQISPVISQTVYDGFLEKGIVSAVEEKIDENINASSVAEKANAVVDSIPEFAISLAGVDTSTIKEQISSIKLDSQNIAQSLVEKIAEPIVVGALKIIIFILLAVVLMIVLRIAAKYISKLFNIPLVKTVNKSLGGVLGAVKGALVLLVVCTGLRFIFGGGEGEFSVVVNESFVVGLLDKINPLVESLSEFIK